MVGIEVKLVAELHEIYGMGAVGGGTERARAYIGSWASRRGIYQVDGGLLLIAGSPLARQLTRRLAARVRRSAFALAPLFTGAVAGAVLNRQGDAAARPRDQRRPAPAPQDSDRHRGPLGDRVTGGHSERTRPRLAVRQPQRALGARGHGARVRHRGA